MQDLSRKLINLKMKIPVFVVVEIGVGGILASESHISAELADFPGDKGKYAEHVHVNEHSFPPSPV